ncbi:hypothetical protein PIIN_00526 [Serendipita indica DSM 11827]|uniref:BHLH domain-containing protein n=1 Tax=Serendipita indica (strain DSM 11827) TaxID=1109443 RepID=G4U2Q0_SERID|nr:hypothetical protein PIIN_00526 [Serendipita indica DSM 11827]
MDYEHSDQIKLENSELDSLVDPSFGLDLLSQPTAQESAQEATPPHEWSSQAWMDASAAMNHSNIDNVFLNEHPDPIFELNNPALDFATLGAINDMHMGVPVDMYGNGFQFMLSPADLHKPPVFPSLVPQTMMPGLSTESASNLQDDLVSAVKRLSGITSAQIAGAPSAFAQDLRDPYINPANFSDNSYSSASSDRSSVPPQTAESVQAGSPPETTSVDSNSPPAIPVRAKTAHTTIERRYRTNLKACIDRLSNSIPAVRCIDKDYKPPSGVPDVVDEKGLVDGVKAARKVSKAIIMSKAHEYIVVLKRRETKLQEEVDGMKALLNSLVGGPRLLQEWERQWAARQAEVAEEEMDTNDMDSDDAEDEDSADERPRKKAKTMPAPVPAKAKKPPVKTAATAAPSASSPTSPTTPVVAKKRGRPSKAAVAARQAAAAASSTTSPSQVQFTAPMSADASVMPTSSPAQYSFVPGLPQPKQAVFFASFVFLSYFKPTARHVVVTPEDNTNHSHLGRVLSSQDNLNGKVVRVHDSVWHSHPALHFAHTAVMVILGLALILSLLPQRKRHRVWRWLSSFFEVPAPASDEHAMSDSESSDEELESRLSQAEQILKAPSNSKARLRLYNALQRSCSTPPTSSELGFMALLHMSSTSPYAQGLWKKASLSANSQDVLRYAFEFPLQDASALLQQSADDTRSCLTILASKSLEDHLERLFKDVFVDTILATCENKSMTASTTTIDISIGTAGAQLLKDARTLGGKPAELAAEWDAALSGRVPATPREATSARTVLHVLALMNRIFPVTSRATASGLPSPPPSPLTTEERVKLERVLRIALDSNTFHGVVGRGAGMSEEERERCEEVRRARDMLVSRLSHAARERRMVALEGRD